MNKGSSSRKGIDRLNDFTQDPQKMSSFARLKMRSKSAKWFEEESLDIKKEARKEAWAPKSKQNLSSSSLKFPRHGKVDVVAEYSHTKPTKPRAIKDFGRVNFSRVII
jgi:hypothetical protein